jgi:hypothetical protein
MDFKEKIRRSKIKLKSEWRRLGLKKNWATFILIAILLPIEDEVLEVLNMIKLFYRKNPNILKF